MRADAHSFAALALSAYAAVIVSFLGGVHWGIGFQMAEPPASLFTWGVVPSLVAWMAVVMPAYAGLVIHGLMLVVCYVVDRRVYPRHGLGHWLTLRFRLSAVAALSCFIGIAGFALWLGVLDWFPFYGLVGFLAAGVVGPAVNAEFGVGRGAVIETLGGCGATLGGPPRPGKVWPRQCGTAFAPVVCRLQS